MRVDRCNNIGDFRSMARRRLPGPIFHYIDGAADDEVTYRRNTEAYERCDLVPNVLAGVESIDTSITVMGQKIDMPLFCAPTALQRLFHHDGERAVAKAAQKFGTMFGISSLGTISVEEIGSRGGNDLPVTFMGRQTNLHAVWDTAIIEQAVKGDERGYAMRLTRDVTQPELSQWSQGDTISWANESHDVATSAVYAQLQHTGILPDGYEAQALPIVNDQVKRAGVRGQGTQ